MRTAYDSTNPFAIPLTAQIVCGYVPPSGFAWPAQGWARFPFATQVRITPSAATVGLGVHVLDVESGDAPPSEAPGWARRQRALGQPPTVYCSASLWQTVQQAFNAAGVPHPAYWIAAYPGGGPTLPGLNGITAVAHQYADPAASGGDWDLSVVADYWPGVDPAPAPPSHRGDTMLIVGSSNKYNTQALASGGLKTNLDAETAGADATLFPRMPVSDTVWNELEQNTAALLALPQQVATLSAQMSVVVSTLQTLTADAQAVPGQISAEQAALLAAIQAEGTTRVSPAALRTALAAANVPPGIITALSAVFAADGTVRA